MTPEKTVHVCRSHLSTHTHTHTDPEIHRGVLQGHTDAIWDLAVHAKTGLLLSCAADGTCRLWNHTLTSPQIKLFQAEPGMHTHVLYTAAVCCVPIELRYIPLLGSVGLRVSHLLTYFPSLSFSPLPLFLPPSFSFSPPPRLPMPHLS